MALQSTTALTSIVLSQATSTVTFSNIPNTYRDLIISMDVLQTGATGLTILRLNGDSGSNYTWVEIWGNGSTSGSSGTTETLMNAGYHISTSPYIITARVFDYAQTNKHKTVLCRDSATGEVVRATANRWANTAAVTSVNISTGSSTFAAGSIFSIYGVIA